MPEATMAMMARTAYSGWYTPPGSDSPRIACGPRQQKNSAAVTDAVIQAVRPPPRMRRAAPMVTKSSRYPNCVSSGSCTAIVVPMKAETTRSTAAAVIWPGR
ncbi:hypothetical protein [Streptomyces antimycoticus]|uniref:hypothetical protein n=1 Tax=Streptomyces antimycoticus TaxID=68175 RepID=UPI0033CCAE5F